MEHIDVKSHHSDTNLTRKAESPSFTPKLSKQRHRLNSEPDLESAGEYITTYMYMYHKWYIRTIIHNRILLGQFIQLCK